MRAIIELRPGERRPALGAFVVLLGITASHTLLETARDALFLAKLPAARLPWVYLAIAAAGLGLTQLSKKGTPRAPTRRGVGTTLLLAAGITGAFWAATALQHDILLYALYVWTGIFASWVVVQLWLLLGASFTVGQAKRVFGFIGAGGVLGAVVGAAGARALAELLPARHLLLGGVFLLVATALGPTALLPRPLEEERSTQHSGAWGDGGRLASERPSLRGDVRLTVGDPFIKRILALILLSTIALTLVDYVFKASVAAAVPKEELGATFASIYLVLNAIALVVQLGVTAWLFRVAGVQRALLVLPVLLLGGTAAVLLGGGLLTALALKGADGALRHSLHKTSAELLFVPIADRVRARVKPVIDLVGQRGGQAVASVLILVAVALGAGTWHLAIAIALLVGLWIASAATIQRPYLDVFRAALREGRIEPSADLPDLDLASLEAIFSALNSGKDAEVLGALDLLAAQERRRLIPALILYHPSKAVVLRALELFVDERRDDYTAIAERLMDQHADPEVRAAALRARAAIEPDESFLRRRLAEGAPEEQATALVVLLARQWARREPGAQPGQIDVDLGWQSDLETRLAEILAESTPAVRVALTRAIELEDHPGFHDTLIRLAEDPSDEVHGAVASAMARIASPRFVPTLVTMLARREQAHAVRDALVAIGPDALEYLDRALSDLTLGRDVRWRIPRAVSMFDATRASKILVRHLGSAPEGIVRFRILRCLARMLRDHPELELDAGVLRKTAETTVERVLELIALRRTLEKGAQESPARRTPAHQLMMTMLRDKESHARDRLFRVLGLLYPAESFERIYRGLASDNAKTRASSRELTENVIGGNLKQPVLVLFDDISDDERLARIPSAPPPPSSYEDAVQVLLARPGALGSLAVYHAAELSIPFASVPPPPPWADDMLSQSLTARAREMMAEVHGAE
jgi:ATP:ADP antiporter, AAA family